MNYAGTARTAMLLGTMPAGTDEAAIHEKVAAECPEIEACGCADHFRQMQDAVYLAVFCLKKEAEKTGRSSESWRICKTIADIQRRSRRSEKENLKAEIQKLNNRD